jgi:hypothetical protein
LGSKSGNNFEGASSQALVSVTQCVRLHAGELTVDDRTNNGKPKDDAGPGGSDGRQSASANGSGNAGAAEPSRGHKSLIPAVSLPSGGGAIRSMGEKFDVNAVTGTASLSLLFGLTPGRGGSGPDLELAYDSGSSNGVFGFGWSASVPEIARKTDKGLPRYMDGEESDVFLLSGAEDLVRVLDAAHAAWPPV